MHRWVVMAHAEDPAALAQQIIETASDSVLAEPMQILDVESASRPGQLADVVVIFELTAEVEGDPTLYQELDRRVRNLAPESGWRIETMRESTPHQG